MDPSGLLPDEPCPHPCCARGGRVQAGLTVAEQVSLLLDAATHEDRAGQQVLARRFRARAAAVLRQEAAQHPEG